MWPNQDYPGVGPSGSEREVSESTIMRDEDPLLPVSRIQNLVIGRAGKARIGSGDDVDTLASKEDDNTAVNVLIRKQA